MPIENSEVLESSADIVFTNRTHGRSNREVFEGFRDNEKAPPRGIIVSQDTSLEDKNVSEPMGLIKEIGAGECDVWLSQVNELRINTIGTQSLVLFDYGRFIVIHVTIAIDRRNKGAVHNIVEFNPSKVIVSQLSDGAKVTGKGELGYNAGLGANIA